MDHEAGSATVDTQVVMRSVKKHREGRVLATIDHRLRFLHPVPILHDRLELAPVHAENRVRILEGARALNAVAVQLRNVLDRHLVEVGDTVEAVKHLAGQITRLVVVVPLIAQVFKLAGHVIRCVQLDHGTDLVIARLLNHRSGFEAGASNGGSQRTKQVVVNPLVDVGVILPLRLAGGINARTDGARGAAGVPDRLAREANGPAGDDTVVQEVDVVRNAVGIQRIGGAGRRAPATTVSISSAKSHIRSTRRDSSRSMKPFAEFLFRMISRTSHE